ADLVVHCAGPFQREPNSTVLEAAIRTKSPYVDVRDGVAFAVKARERGFNVPPFPPSPHSPNYPPSPPQTPYVDVCDDVAFAGNARSLHGAAVAAGVPAITTAGIYPGVSNCPFGGWGRGGRLGARWDQEQRAMLCSPVLILVAVVAAELVRLAGEEGARMEEQQGQQQAALGLRPKSLRCHHSITHSLTRSFTHTLTHLHPPSSNFVMSCRSSALVSSPAPSQSLHPLPSPMHAPSLPIRPTPNLTPSAFHLSFLPILLLPLPSPSFSYFTVGTGGAGPTILTTSLLLLLLQRMVGALEPLAVLQDRSAVQRIVGALEPLVRATDGSAGERVAMRVDLETENGRSTTARISHRRLSVSVGVATAAFAAALLEGTSMPGVHYPEQSKQAAAIPVAQREKL
ncbi:unnamed protein product, partial [Closterium sp. Naga37s-1]